MPTTINCLLRDGAAQLRDLSDTAKLDIEVMLCEVLQCNRTKLITDGNYQLKEKEERRFNHFLQQRIAGKPVSYIIGHQDFWTLRLNVEESTLIPRPETELLVEQALALGLDANSRCLDLGTGTGAIALALAVENPNWQIMGTDRVTEAVTLARSNQKLNGVENVSFSESHWFDNIKAQKFDIIVSNPPYVEPDSIYLQQGDVRFEPLSALIAEDNGMADIEHIIKVARDFLIPHGWLLLEHGFEQAGLVQECFRQHGYESIATVKDYAGLDRVTMAKNGVA